MTDHPCKGMAKPLVDIFERIAINESPRATWGRMGKLLAAGVVERGPDDMRRDAMGPYAIPSFFIPLPVHTQWCEWCSEQIRDVRP